MGHPNLDADDCGFWMLLQAKLDQIAIYLLSSRRIATFQMMLPHFCHHDKHDGPATGS